MNFQFLSLLITSLVALFLGAGGGDWIRREIWKPKLVFKELMKVRQGGKVIWRLVIENQGRATAKNVQVEATRIYEGKGARNDFLSLPLRWSHMDRIEREILSNQTAYLDVLELVDTDTRNIRSEHKLKLASYFGSGTPLPELSEKATQIDLVSYQRRGIKQNISVKVVWDGDMLLEAKLEGSGSSNR